MSITEKSRFQQFRRNWSSRFRASRIDRENRQRYGENAPQFAELLWVPVSELEYSVKVGSSKQSAQVMQSWPSDAVRVTRDLDTIRACLAHWQDGLTWQETGIYNNMLRHIKEYGKVDRLRSLEDIEARYHYLDALYLQVVAAKKFETRSNLVPGNFREEGGLLVHIGPEGGAVFRQERPLPSGDGDGCGY